MGKTSRANPLAMAQIYNNTKKKPWMYIVQVHIFCVANICLFFPISFTKKEKLSLSCEAFEGKEFAMEIREKKKL